MEETADDAADVERSRTSVKVAIDELETAISLKEQLPS
jgi:hypothetical protein